MRCTRWQGLPFSSKPKVKKGLWSPEEDEKLINYMMKNGLLGCSWSYLAKQIGLQRCGKSCRLRWTNYLRPGLKRGAISPEEEQLIIHLQSIFGNRWSQIVAYLPGRTDNDIKNYWNSCIRKKLNLKQWLPCSSTTEPNGNNNIKPNIQNVMGTAENEYSCVQEVLDLKYEQLNMPNNVLPVDQNSFITAPATTAWSSTHSYSNEAEFTDVYPGAYTTHNVEHYLSLQENTTNKSCPSQFSTPGITWPNVEQSSNFQAQGQYEWQDPVNSSYHGEAYFGEPVYNINVHTQNSYQLPEIGGEQDVDQGDWSTIPINEKAEATSIPRLSMLGFQCESESDQVTVWAQDDHFYSRVPFL